MNFQTIIDNELTQNHIIEFCAKDILTLLHLNKYINNSIYSSQQIQNLKNIQLYRHKLLEYSIHLDEAIDTVGKSENITSRRKYTSVSLIISSNSIYNLYNSQVKSKFEI